MNKCVAIVGFGRKRDGVPWADDLGRPRKRRPGWDIWACNPPDSVLKKAAEERVVNRWFELHDLRIHRIRREHYLAWLGALEIPVMVLDTVAWLPTSERFPLDAIEKLLPKYGDYHCGSFDMLMAYAIWCGYRRITLHGMDYREGEPDSSVKCLEFWLGVAAGRGIKIDADDSVLLLRNMQRRTIWEQFGEDGREGGRYGYDIAAWPREWENENTPQAWRNRVMCGKPWHFMSEAEREAHPEQDPANYEASSQFPDSGLMVRKEEQ